MAEPRRSAVADAGDLKGVRMLIVEARFYDDIADALLAGATRALETSGAPAPCPRRRKAICNKPTFSC